MIPPVDPVSAAISGGGLAMSLASGIANALADQGAQKRNKTQLDELLAKEKAGQLGLTGTQRDLMDRSLNEPVAQAAAAARSRAEQIQASTGGGSGADLSRLRTEQSRTQAAGAQNAALQVNAANEQAKLAQRNEIEQREAEKTARRQNDYNSIFGTASQIAGTAGEMAGVPKGAPSAAPDLGSMSSLYSGDELSKLQDYARANPQEFMKMFLAQTGGA